MKIVRAIHQFNTQNMPFVIHFGITKDGRYAVSNGILQGEEQGLVVFHQGDRIQVTGIT